jgi:DNA/RNA-binding domain of Phe-tRNA-synthetase-like protein
VRFEVSHSILKLFPNVTIAIVRGEISEIRPGFSEEIAAMRERAADRMKEMCPDQQALVSHVHVAEWRKAYQAFGVKPKTHKPTHEALARRLLKQGTWPEINPIVDVYLTNQMTHLLPHGGYDAARLQGDLRLDVCSEAETFEPLGGGEESTSAGEVVYRDDARVLTRRWNYRDCDATKITDETRQFLLMIESPSAEIALDAVEAASTDLAERYSKCYQGTFSSTVFRPTEEVNWLELA